MMQSPIDLDDNLKATIHAPIEYRNYFVNANDNNRVSSYKKIKASPYYAKRDNSIISFITSLIFPPHDYLFFSFTMASCRTPAIPVSILFADIYSRKHL